MNSLFMEMEVEVGRRIIEVDFTNTVLLTKLVLTGTVHACHSVPVCYKLPVTT